MIYDFGEEPPKAWTIAFAKSHFRSADGELLRVADPRSGARLYAAQQAEPFKGFGNCFWQSL